MIELRPIQPTERKQFQQMAERYWQELMPKAGVVQDADQRFQYFLERFPWDDSNHWIQWAMVDGKPIGFVSVTIALKRKEAMIEDFYVLPNERRKGYGTAIRRALYRQFDQIGIELVELHVRRDNPQALAFWEAQGFRIALYRMRQYRDPQTGESFIGALSSDFA